MKPILEELESRSTPSLLGAQIGGTVWKDVNHDSVWDTTEVGYQGLEVRLYEVGTVNPIATTTTDANGEYHFGNLSRGDYLVTFEPFGVWELSDYELDNDFFYNDIGHATTGIIEVESVTDILEFNAGIWPNN